MAIIGNGSGREVVRKRGSVGEIVGGDKVVKAMGERKRKEGPHWEKHRHKLTAVSMEFTTKAKSEILVYCFLISDVIGALAEVDLLHSSDME